MNQETYDYQKLQAYLLAELSGEEEERFDELSITDEQFDAALKTTENDLLDAYASGEMDAATRRKFESIYLASPLRREKIAFAGAFQNFTEKQSDTIAFSSKNEPAEETNWLSLRNLFKNQNSFLQWGFAAAALAVLFVGILWFLNSNHRQTEIARQSETPAPQIVSPSPAPASQNSATVQPTAIAENVNSLQTENGKKSNVNRNAVESKPSPEKAVTPAPKPVIASFILAPPLRGANNIPVLSVPRDAARVNIELQLEANDYRTYRVALTRESGGADLWQANSLKVFGSGENKSLRVSFPAELLKSGIFLLSVSGVSQNGAAENIATYPFRCVIK